jgi:hypothetical protein
MPSGCVMLAGKLQAIGMLRLRVRFASLASRCAQHDRVHAPTPVMLSVVEASLLTSNPPLSIKVNRRSVKKAFRLSQNALSTYEKRVCFIPPRWQLGRVAESARLPILDQSTSDKRCEFRTLPGKLQLPLASRSDGSPDSASKSFPR